MAGKAAPDFTFTDIDGQPHRLSDYRGKVVLLDFWGTWCKGCVAETQELVKAYEKFHEKGFEILGVATHDTEADLRKFLTARKVAWTQTMEGEDGPLQTLYRVTGFPTHFLIGKNGSILANRIQLEELPAMLEKQLGVVVK
jgi:peroxiredoxin